MPRKTLVLFLAVLFAAALGMSRAFSEDKYAQQMRTFTRIMDQIMENYVSEVEVEDLFQGAYRGMLRKLDPYTQYLPPQDTKMFAEETEGQFGGLGIEITIKDDVLTVISPIRGTPAYEAGIHAGDMILKVDGVSTERISLGGAVKRLRGKPGTKVTLTVRNRGEIVERDVVVTRAIIKNGSIEYAIIDKERGIGLVRISSFNAQVMKDLKTAVAEMQKQGLRGMILDLRQNPGGLLTVAMEMCDEFLAEGIIVSVRGRHKVRDQVSKAKPGDSLEEVALVVLIDRGSASASEIVAGCIRDHDRGKLVGATTYGKGSVQNVIPLGGGQLLKLTTARYHTPNGNPIEHRVGIEPDIPVPMSIQHRIALRNQEREDKLRGIYHIGGALESTAPNGDANADEEPEPNAENDNKLKKQKRHGRDVDLQLKAGLSVLKIMMESNPGKHTK